MLAFGLDHRFGVATVGPIDGGLPTLAWPPFDLALWLDVMPASAMIALVAYVQSFSIGTQLAHRKRQRLNPNQELIALGAADFGAAFTGGMPVAGSMSRSTGGGRTALTGVFCALFVLVTVLWLTPYFSALPHAALAAIIIMSVSDFIDFSPVYRYWKFYRHDSITHVVALLAVLMFGVERGLLIGILVAVALFVRRSSRPHIAIVGRVGDSAHFRSELRHQVATHPHVMAVRIDENLYFANANLVETRLLRLVSRNAEDPPPAAGVQLDQLHRHERSRNARARRPRVDAQRREAASVGGERTGDGPAERIESAARTCPVASSSPPTKRCANLEKLA